MKCKDCGCEHPPEYVASPHWCIARLQERIEVLERQLKQIGAEYDRLWKRWEARKARGLAMTDKAQE